MAASAVAVAGLVFVARTAAVELGETALWPGNPAVLSAHIMSDVGQAAARGEAPNEQTLAQLEQLAAKEPLTAQPFLVHGAMAARTGDFDRAEKLLAIARQRAPRSAAARYLMGSSYACSGPVKLLSKPPTSSMLDRRSIRSDGHGGAAVPSG